MKKLKMTWWFFFIVGALPSLIMAGLYLYNPRALGIDPVESLLQQSGEWALRFLLISLACSPLRRLGWKALIRYRRMFGLFAFYYASLHMFVYIVGWVQLEWLTLLDDVTTRPFIFIGLLTWLVLLVLAVTSPKVVVKYLKRRWVLIHRMVYLAIIAALIHLWMQSRASAFEAVVYIFITFILLVERLIRSQAKSFLAKAKAKAIFLTPIK